MMVKGYQIFPYFAIYHTKIASSNRWGYFGCEAGLNRKYFYIK